MFAGQEWMIVAGKSMVISSIRVKKGEKGKNSYIL